MRATKLITEIRHLNYEERLKLLNLPTLKYRRLRGDKILVFKLVTVISNDLSLFSFKFSHNIFIRGNLHKLFRTIISHYDLGRHFFVCNRIITAWNYVVSAPSIDSFKNRLDKCWINRNTKFSWRDDVTGTGSRTSDKNSVNL